MTEAFTGAGIFDCASFVWSSEMDLSIYERGVLSVLYMKADHQGQVEKSKKWIADASGISERKVYNILKELERKTVSIDGKTYPLVRSEVVRGSGKIVPFKYTLPPLFSYRAVEISQDPVRHTMPNCQNSPAHGAISVRHSIPDGGDSPAAGAEGSRHTMPEDLDGPAHHAEHLNDLNDNNKIIINKRIPDEDVILKLKAAGVSHERAVAFVYGDMEQEYILHHLLQYNALNAKMTGLGKPKKKPAYLCRGIEENYSWNIQIEKVTIYKMKKHTGEYFKAEDPAGSEIKNPDLWVRVPTGNLKEIYVPLGKIKNQKDYYIEKKLYPAVCRLTPVEAGVVYFYDGIKGNIELLEGAKHE